MRALRRRRAVKTTLFCGKWTTKNTEGRDHGMPDAAIGCTSVVQCERTVVLWSVEMRNFSVAECGKAVRGNLRNAPQLIFCKLPIDIFQHSAKYPRCKNSPGGTRTMAIHLAGKHTTCRATQKIAKICAIFLWNFAENIISPHLPSPSTAPPDLSTFTPASESEIRKILSNCPDKQSDSAIIPTWLLKECTSVLVPTITDIVNPSLTSGQFHPILKESVISPLLKKSTLDKDQLSNYRPICNLSHIQDNRTRCQIPPHRSPHFQQTT